VFLCVLGAVLGLGGLVGAGYFLIGHEARDTTQILALAGCSLGIAVLGFTCAWGSFATILVLRQDELEVPGVFRSTVIRRRDVRGFRIVPVQGINVLHVEWTHPVTGKARRTKISVLFKPDAALMAWFDGIANFDAMEVAASVQEVADDPQLGASAEERLENVNRARKIARVLHGVSWAGAGWALFYPHPYTLVVVLLAVLPALALWLCWKYKGSFSVEDRGPNAARADITALLLVPGLILALRAMWTCSWLIRASCSCRRLSVSSSSSASSSGRRPAIAAAP
jgi:hypothetical protein